jgi:arginine N-succinyltransferase
MKIRPISRSDTNAIMRVAKEAGIGMTSLPPNEEVINAKIERACQSFERSLEDKNNALYFFVLEDTRTNQIVGTCGIEGHIGLKRPMYSYKITTVTQYSDTLGIYSRNDMLQMVNDYAGVSELVSLFLLPEYRRDRLGRFLSRVRFMFMAEFLSLFDARIIAEIRGWHDGAGNSPFYNSLAKHFFQMEFTAADAICATKGNRFISELMPTYPIYISLLPTEARNVIGRPYSSSEAAKAMLEREGFQYNNYIDIFDGGPTLEAKTSDIRSIKLCKKYYIKDITPISESGEKMMLSNSGFADFKATLSTAKCNIDDNSIIISPTCAKILQVDRGQYINAVPA